MTCSKISMRAENLSDHIKLYRSDYSRAYKEKQRRSEGIPIRQLSKPRFRGDRFLAYIDRYIMMIRVDTGESNNIRMFLNGIPVEPTDQRCINRIRNGSVKLLKLERVDQLATRYHLPLWEIEEAAGSYKKDIRAARRDRRLKAS